MKKLTQAVFSLPECPPWAKSATVDIDGTACYFAHTKEYLCVLQVSKIWGHKEKLFGANCKEFGTDYDTTNWQQSAINREGWEL